MLCQWRYQLRDVSSWGAAFVLETESNCYSKEGCGKNASCSCSRTTVCSSETQAIAPSIALSGLDRGEDNAPAGAPSDCYWTERRNQTKPVVVAQEHSVSSIGVTEEHVWLRAAKESEFFRPKAREHTIESGRQWYHLTINLYWYILNRNPTETNSSQIMARHGRQPEQMKRTRPCSHNLFILTKQTDNKKHGHHASLPCLLAPCPTGTPS